MSLDNLYYGGAGGSGGGGGGTVTNVADSSTLDMSLTGTTVTANIKVSSQPGNALIINSDGLYVSQTGGGGGGTSYTFNDTASIDFTVATSNVSAAVKVSPDSGNAIQSRSNGLFVPVASGGNGSIAVADSTSIDLSFANSTISGVVRVSPNSGNRIQALSNGLFVGPESGYGSGQVSTVSDTTTIDLTLASSNLSAAVRVSAIAGNILTSNTDGLYVPTPLATAVVDTPTVDMTLTPVSGGVNISSAVKIDPVSDNVLQATSNGLYVPAATVSNTPTFSARSNATQAIAANTLTKVLFQTEEFDIGSSFASSRFTAPEAAIYSFNASLWLITDPVVTDAGVWCLLYINGSYTKTLGRDVTGVVPYANPSGVANVSLAQGDYVEIYVYSDATGNLSLSISAGGGGGSTTNFFSGFKLAGT